MDWLICILMLHASPWPLASCIIFFDFFSLSSRTSLFYWGFSHKETPRICEPHHLWSCEPHMQYNSMREIDLIRVGNFLSSSKSL